MYRFLMAFAFCGVLLMACQDTIETFSEKDIEVITQKLDLLSGNLYDQYNNQEIDTYLDNFDKSEALTVMINGTLIKSWDSFSQREREARKEYQKMQATKKKTLIDVLNPEMAFVTHFYEWSGVNNAGEELLASGVMVLTYRKVNGDWKIVLWADHYEMVPSTEP